MIPETDSRDGDAMPRPLQMLSMFEKALGWLAFLCIMALSWLVAVPRAVQRCNDDLFPRGPLIPVPGIVARRPYLMALCAYAVATAWIFAAFFSLALLIYCTVLTMTKGKIKDHVAWDQMVEWLANPRVVLHALHQSHAPAHAVIAVGTLVGMALIVGFYVTDDDLAESMTTQTTQTSALEPAHVEAPTYYVKTNRALVLVPLAMGITYTLYALVHIAS